MKLSWSRSALGDDCLPVAQHLLRGLVAPTGRQVGGADDVRKEDGDGAFGKLLRHSGEPLQVSALILVYLPGIVKVGRYSSGYVDTL